VKEIPPQVSIFTGLPLVKLLTCTLCEKEGRPFQGHQLNDCVFHPIHNLALERKKELVSLATGFARDLYKELKDQTQALKNIRAEYTEFALICENEPWYSLPKTPIKVSGTKRKFELTEIPLYIELEREFKRIRQEEGLSV
jgi:hypothetical protein